MTPTQGYMASRREQEQQQAGVQAALSESAKRSHKHGRAADRAAAAAKEAEEAPPQEQQEPGDSAVEEDEADGSPPPPPSDTGSGSGGGTPAAGSSSMTKRLAGRLRCGSGRPSLAHEDSLGDPHNDGSLYGRLAKKLPLKDRLNVKARVERRIVRYGEELFPELAASIGVEAAAGALAAAVPGGIRDAGVRMVDRVEALMRRWAIFGGGVAVLFRVLLWHH